MVVLLSRELLLVLNKISMPCGEYLPFMSVMLVTDLALLCLRETEDAFRRFLLGSLGDTFLFSVKCLEFKFFLHIKKNYITYPVPEHILTCTGC